MQITFLTRKCPPVHLALDVCWFARAIRRTCVASHVFRQHVETNVNATLVLVSTLILVKLLSECCIHTCLNHWAVRKKEERTLHTTEMRMLRWARGKTRLDHVRNVDIWKEARMYPMAEFLREKRLRWFGHVQMRDNLKMMPRE